ncbi:MAG: hypothetical protein RLZZ15_958, partial [Verrucomicrobiota bacterium]
GDYAAAEQHQLAHLAAAPAAGPREWGALGDLRLALADPAGAKSAYAEARRRLDPPSPAPPPSSDDKRYLVYLLSRLDAPARAQTLAAELLAENPADRATLLVLLSLALDQQDASATRRLAQTFLDFYPGDQQGRYFLGAGYLLARRFDEAAAVFRNLKREQFAARPFPYESDLAAASSAAGDWAGAMNSYRELLAHPDRAAPVREQVRRALDGLEREHRPRLEAASATTRLAQARVRRTDASVAAHPTPRTWLALSCARDDVALDATPGLRPATSARAEAVATLTTVHNPRWTTEAALGASGAGALLGGRARYAFAPDRAVALELAAAARATDSLALELLDGREDRAALAIRWALPRDFVFAARAQRRAVSLAHESLGAGAALDLNLDRAFTRADRHPEFILGYRGTWAAFSPDAAARPDLVAPLADPGATPAARSALLATLISRRINRHGLGATLADQRGSVWRYRLSTGADFDFERAAPAWNAALALTFLPRKNIELTTELGHTSSAAASNAGSAATLLNFSLRAHY